MAAPHVRGLLIGSLLARLPRGMISLSVFLLVHANTGSYAFSGLALGAVTVMSAASSPALGWALERFGARGALAPSAAVHAGLLVVFAASGGTGAGAGVLVALAGAVGATLPPVSTCARALWPSVSRGPAELETIYGLDATTEELIWVVGPLLVAGTLAAASAAAALLLCAAVTVLGAGAFLSVTPVRTWRRGRGPGKARRKSGLGRPGVGALLGAMALGGMMASSVEVGLPSLAAHLHRGGGAAGLMLALWSLASMVGGLLYGMYRKSSAIQVHHRRLLLCVAVLTTPLIVAGTLPLALLFSVLAGIALAPMVSCEYSLTSYIAARGGGARAFAWQAAADITGGACGSALAGVLAGSLGAGGPFMLASAAGLLGFALVRARPLQTAATRAGERPTGVHGGRGTGAREAPGEA